MLKTNQALFYQKYFATNCFTCDLHKEWGFNFASKIIINFFFNNKQNLINATVRKYVTSFKSRERKIKLKKQT